MMNKTLSRKATHNAIQIFVVTVDVIASCRALKQSKCCLQQYKGTCMFMKKALPPVGKNDTINVSLSLSLSLSLSVSVSFSLCPPPDCYHRQ